MKKLITITIAVLMQLSTLIAEKVPEIVKSEHCFCGCPKGGNAKNHVLLRSIYALSSNHDTKFADWVAYKLTLSELAGSEKKRNWKADPDLKDEETLEPPDYKNCSSVGYDRGHQAPLADFKGADEWEAANYLSNITPQKSDLNQGPWEKLEDKERFLCKEFGVIYIITGPLYEKEYPALPNADEPHKVPSGYWKIIIVPEKKIFHTASFIFGQDSPREAILLDHVTTIHEIEKRAKLDFLWELDDATENKVESDKDLPWIESQFNLVKDKSHNKLHQP